MAAGNLRVTRTFCESCSAQVKFEKSSINWGGGDLIMIMLTFGGWVAAKFIYHMAFNPWRCSSCGSK